MVDKVVEEMEGETVEVAVEVEVEGCAPAYHSAAGGGRVTSLGKYDITIDSLPKCWCGGRACYLLLRVLNLKTIETTCMPL